MYQCNYTHSYLANPSIKGVFKREVAYETGEGHLLRASHLTRAKIFFDFGAPHSVTSYALNIGEVSRICVNGNWFTKSSHSILYQFYRGTITQSEMCSKLTAWPCGTSSPQPRPSSGTIPPASPILVPPNDVDLTALMTKLEAIENVLHRRRPDGQPPRRKKKSTRTTFKPIVFVSSSDEKQSESENNPTSEDSDLDKTDSETSPLPDKEGESPAPTPPVPKIIPYDDTYDRMSTAYRRRGLKFLQAMDFVLVCEGTGDFAMRMYLQMHNAHDIILGSGYRLTKSRAPQLDAMQRIADENGIVQPLIRLWNLVPRAPEESPIVGKLSYEQLHFCCVHPPPPAQDQ